MCSKLKEMTEWGSEPKKKKTRQNMLSEKQGIGLACFRGSSMSYFYSKDFYYCLLWMFIFHFGSQEEILFSLVICCFTNQGSNQVVPLMFYEFSGIQFDCSRCGLIQHTVYLPNSFIAELIVYLEWCSDWCPCFRTGSQITVVVSNVMWPESFTV